MTIYHITTDGQHCGDDECTADDHTGRPKMHRLDNADTWTTRDGQTLRFEDMTPSHRVNTLRMLLRHAPSYAMSYWEQIWTDPILAPRGDMATLDVEQMTDEAFEEPHDWLLTTPCGAKLLNLIRADGMEVLL